MSNQSIQQHPRFGFNEKRLQTITFTDTSLSDDGFQRTSGLIDGVVVEGNFSLTAGGGEVNLLLEGSNDSANWTLLSELGTTDYFTTDGDQKVLASDTAALAPVERFAFLRVRAVIVSGAPVFSLAVQVTCIHRDAEKFNIPATFIRSAAFMNGDMVVRPRGTKLSSVQVVASNVVLGGAASFLVSLQGTPDGGTTWMDIATGSITGDGSQVLLQDTSRLIDFGAYANFRFRVEDVGGAGTSYTVETYVGLDSADWVIVGPFDDSGGGGGGSAALEAAMLEVTFGAPGVEGANTIVVPFTVIDSNGAPVTSARTVHFLVYDTLGAGELDLSTNGTFSAVGGGAVAVVGIATNEVLVTTAADGTGTLSILNAAAESVYVTGAQPSAPLSAPQVVWEAGEATLTFA